MSNPYIERVWPAGAQDPAIDAFVITPSDSVNFVTNAKGIYVGITGNITLVTLLGTVIQFQSVPAGTTLACQAIRVNLTGTSAGALVGLI